METGPSASSSMVPSAPAAVSASAKPVYFAAGSILTHDGVHVLSGKCTKCDTKYYADHESSKYPGVVAERRRFYLNSAKYLEVGQSLWVDQSFSGAVINATYSFHISSAAFAEFWNDSFWSIQETSSRKLSQRQVWHAFVQESI